MNGNFVTYFGVLVAIVFLGQACWRVNLKKFDYKADGVVLAAGVFFGMVLFLSPRLTEVSITDIGTIKAATERATSDAQQISQIRQRIESQAATVDAIAKEAADAKSATERIEAANKTADEKIENIDEAVKSANGTLSNMRLYTDFSRTVLAAQSDSRAAFDQLGRWAQDPKYPMAKDAASAWQMVLDSHASPLYESGFKVPWKDGVDPSKLSFDQLVKGFDSAPSFVQLGLLETAWNRRDFSKRRRMKFLVSVMQTNQSLRVLEYAGRYFNEGSKDNLKPLAIAQHLEWWRKNMNSVH